MAKPLEMSDGAGYGEAHGGEAVGDDAGVRAVAGILAANPHLVRAHVGDEDVGLTEYLADIAEDFLRLHRVGGVVGVLRVLLA